MATVYRIFPKLLAPRRFPSAASGACGTIHLVRSNPLDLVRPKLAWRILFPAIAAGCLLAGLTGKGLIWFVSGAVSVSVAFVAVRYVIVIDRDRRELDHPPNPISARGIFSSTSSTKSTSVANKGLEYFPMRIECRDRRGNYLKIETWFWSGWRSVAESSLRRSTPRLLSRSLRRPVKRLEKAARPGADPARARNRHVLRTAARATAVTGRRMSPFRDHRTMRRAARDCRDPVGSRPGVGPSQTGSGGRSPTGVPDRGHSAVRNANSLCGRAEPQLAFLTGAMAR